MQTTYVSTFHYSSYFMGQAKHCQDENRWNEGYVFITKHADFEEITSKSEIT